MIIPAALLDGMTREDLYNLIAYLAEDKSYHTLTANAGKFLLQHIDKNAVYDVVFFDLAGLHSTNSAIGYDRSNEVFGIPIAKHRQDDMLVSLKFSGDEFFALVPHGDGVEYCRRLIRGWAAQYENLTEDERNALQHPATNDPRVVPINQFTASFGVVGGVSGDMVSEDTLRLIETAINPIKNTGKRGFILDVVTGEIHS